MFSMSATGLLVVNSAEVPAPSGVVTFLFTDVEGSTRRWEADADAMRAALAAHDEMLRNAIEAREGWLFKHTGDGVCAAFASPRSAVDAAVAAQRALELPVRMGLATGEAELRDEDYFGAVLNRAARVMAAGHGGQILLADSTAGLLSGVDLIDLGPRRLRDLPAPIGVFQVRGAGLRTEFPPLRALDVSPGNLPGATTSFIGRESEAGEVHAAVKAHRLVTLTGVGGVGKTRLALEVAARLADEFPDGVWFFELAAVTDPAAVPDAVAAVLGITQQPGKSVSESVASALEGRLRLLVFDNCEHVLNAAGDLIEAILAQSATVRAVATSREGLGIADERLWQVPPLDVGAGVDSAAVSLFIERAQAISPRFSVTSPAEADAVVEICGRLDGIPLAIELAASRMASMTANEVRDRLDQRFRLLVGSRRGLERHHTLRHAVAWSYDLLEDAEKALLDRCSVFAGGFDLHSACAVMGSDDDFATLDLLDVLVRKSLLVADRSSGRTRYSMLETIRQFAEEQLVAGGEASEIRATHASYFAGREADIMALWDSTHQREAYDWFTIELANLRTAFRWAADHGDLDVAATIASYAGWLGVLVQTLEPIAWAEELIEPARIADHPRLAFLYVTASLCYATGRIEEAVRYSDAGQIVVGNSHEAPPYGIEAAVGSVYLVIGQPERMAEVCRAQLHAAATPTSTSGHGWLPPLHRPVRVGRRWIARMASSRLRRQQATRCFSGGRSGPTVWLSVTRIPLRRLMPSAGVWWSLKTAATAPSRQSWRTVWQDLRPNTATRWPRPITSPWLSADSTMRATPRRSASRWPSSPLFSTGSAATNRRPLSPASRSVLCLRRRSPKSPPRSPTSARSSVTRPTNRSPARAKQ